MLKVYDYKNCGTCKKALKFLDSKKVSYQSYPIRETPPSKKEIKSMISYLDGEIKKLFNTSGQDYRQMNIKEKLPDMTQKQIIDLLAENGNLIKRPFVIASNNGWVGFKEEEWKEKLRKL